MLLDTRKADTVEDLDDMQPPTDSPHLPNGYPPPSVADPSAGGALCGAHRRPGQIRQDVEAGNLNPWPYCQKRAGWGTSHPKIGRCKDHGGATPNQERNVRLKLAELVDPAVETAARLLIDPNTPPSVKARVYADLLDRNGYPRRIEVDTDAGRSRLHARIQEWQAEQDDEDPDDPVDD